MTYPPAPWTLCGDALQTLQIVDRARARSLVPSELKAIPILPGKALAGIFLASYGPGSVLEYHELIVAVAAHGSGRWGFWIIHIYVDDANSMAGGRDIWGLPKELAQFTWKKGAPNRVVVRQGERLLCSLEYGRQRWLWRQRVPFPCFSVLEGKQFFFQGAMDARLGLASGRLHVPDESPFAALGLGLARLTYHFGGIKFVIGAPKAMK